LRPIWIEIRPHRCQPWTQRRRSSKPSHPLHAARLRRPPRPWTREEQAQTTAAAPPWRPAPRCRGPDAAAASPPGWTAAGEELPAGEADEPRRAAAAPSARCWAGGGGCAASSTSAASFVVRATGWSSRRASRWRKSGGAVGEGRGRDSQQICMRSPLQCIPRRRRIRRLLHGGARPRLSLSHGQRGRRTMGFCRRAGSEEAGDDAAIWR